LSARESSPIQYPFFGPSCPQEFKVKRNKIDEKYGDCYLEWHEHKAKIVWEATDSVKKSKLVHA
jgi:hypothetical protein